MTVTVHWRHLGGDSDLGWNMNRGFYADCTTYLSEILYLGKVDGMTGPPPLESLR